MEYYNTDLGPFAPPLKCQLQHQKIFKLYPFLKIRGKFTVMKYEKLKGSYFCTSRLISTGYFETKKTKCFLLIFDNYIS